LAELSQENVQVLNTLLVELKKMGITAEILRLLKDDIRFDLLGEAMDNETDFLNYLKSLVVAYAERERIPAPSKLLDSLSNMLTH